MSPGLLAIGFGDGHGAERSTADLLGRVAASARAGGIGVHVAAARIERVHGVWMVQEQRAEALFADAEIAARAVAAPQFGQVEGNTDDGSHPAISIVDRRIRDVSRKSRPV